MKTTEGNLPFILWALKIDSTKNTGIINVLIELVEKLLNGFFAVVPRCKPQKKYAQEALLIAHRGAHHHSRGIIENTLEAFRLARDIGCWGLEFDVHATVDKVLVVNHDPTLKRLWGHDLAIADLSFSELRALVPGIPSLQEVVDEFGQTLHLFIELKAPFTAQDQLIDDLKNLRWGVDYHLLTLDPIIIPHLSQFPKQSILLVPVHNNVRQFCDLSIQEGYGGVLGNYLLLTDQVIRELKQAKQLYAVGFVESKYSLYRELNRGIEWLFTNQPARISHDLKRLLS